MKTAARALAGALVALALPAAAQASTSVVIPEPFHSSALDGDSIVYATNSYDSRAPDRLVRHNLVTGARQELFTTRDDINGVTVEEGRIVFGVERTTRPFDNRELTASSVRELAPDGSVRVVTRQGSGRCAGAVRLAGAGPGGVVYSTAEVAPCARQAKKRVTIALRAHSSDGSATELRRVSSRRRPDWFDPIMGVSRGHIITIFDLFLRSSVVPLAGGPATILRSSRRAIMMPFDVSASGRLLVLAIRARFRTGKVERVSLQLLQVGEDREEAVTLESGRKHPTRGLFCGENVVTWSASRKAQTVRVLDLTGTLIAEQTGPGINQEDGFSDLACDAERLFVMKARKRSTRVDIFDLP